MQVFGRFDHRSMLDAHLVDAISNQFACLQLDAVIQDAVLATRATDIEGDEIGAHLKCRIEEIAGIDIVSAAVHSTTIDGSIFIARLPNSLFRTVHSDGDG